jgi:2'-5' RNA ligase
MRCFIGVMLPEEIKEKIKGLQDQIKSLPINCKFVEDYNLHVCLSFLGEISEEKIDFISHLLDKICEKYNKFEVKVAKIKLIPSKNYVRVIALDLIDSETFDKLRREIAEKIGGDSKPLHVTLCRVKSILNRQKFLDKIKKIEEIKVGNFLVEKVQIIESKLKREGPIYTIIKESKLK